MEKILTIIIPSYNMEAYLPKCLGSLIIDNKELLRKLDVIVVNDGSKDRTSEIAHEFEAKYPGVFRVIDKANGHYGSCINAALPVAEGAYVKVLDADDWFDTSVFNRYLEFVDGESKKGEFSADLILNDFIFLTESGKIERRFPFVTCNSDVSVFDYIDRGGGWRDIWMHAIAYKLENLRRIHYVQLTGITHTDIQWIHLPMATVRRIAYCKGLLYMYVSDRENNTSNEQAYYRTFHDQLAVFKTLVSEYNRMSDEVDDYQKIYLQNHLRHRARRAYWVYLYNCNPLLKKGALEDFDRFLKNESSWLYDETGKMCFSGEIPFHFIRVWRRHRRVSLFYYLTMKFFGVVQKLYGMIKRIVK